MNRLELGSRGYYGLTISPSMNAKIMEANILVDEYNRKINSFTTYEEQIEFTNKINEQIKNLIGHESK